MSVPAVLHILATAHEQGASIARMVRTLAQTVDPARYRVEVWFLGGEGPLAEELADAGVPVRTFTWAADRRDVAGAVEIWRNLRRNRFDIAHVHVGGRATPLVVRAASRAKVILHLHYSGAEGGLRGPIHIQPWMADQVVALSRAVADKVSGMPPRVVYHGIALPNDPTSRPRRRDETTVLGVASRLVPIKGLSHLIGALALLHREQPHVRVEVAGAGADAERLEDEADALGVRDAMTFVGWQRDIWPWLARWDVLVQPSLDEGFGMAALEAMAAGVPVVASRVGGIPELVEDGRTGYLVPPADPPALAARLGDLVSNADRRRAMGRAARTRVRERFSAERMTADCVGIYDELLGVNRTVLEGSLV